MSDKQRDTFLQSMGITEEEFEKCAEDLYGKLVEEGVISKEAFMPMPGGNDPMAGGGAPPMDPMAAGGAPPMDPMGGGGMPPPPMDPGGMPPPPMDPMAGGAPPMDPGMAPPGDELEMIKPIIADVVKEVLQEMGISGEAAPAAPAESDKKEVTNEDIMRRLDEMSDRIDKVEGGTPGVLPDEVGGAVSMGEVPGSAEPPMTETDVMGSVGRGDYDITEKPAEQNVDVGLNLLQKIAKLRGNS